MAIPSCQKITTGSAVDVMSSQISNHTQVAISSCPISTLRSAVDAMSSQVSNHIHVAIPSCLISTTSRSAVDAMRSEEHTSELQSLMRISYAVFCLKKQNKHNLRLKSTTIDHAIESYHLFILVQH